MIVTVTPNPGVDRTISLGALQRGAVHRAPAVREDPGGKGVNVSRALALHGTSTTAVLPVGGTVGDELLALLAVAGVPTLAVPISAATRTNIALVEPDGTTTKVNEPGPVHDEAEARRLDDAVAAMLPRARWVVGCGSVPPGVGDDVYARLVARARAAGVRVAVDTSGMPLTRAVAARPHLVTPNRLELGSALGRDLGTAGDVAAAAREIVAGGVEEVLVSLGRDGALLVTGHEIAHARAHLADATPVSTVGAGDALLAGYLHAESAGADRQAALRTAVAFGTAAVALPGTRMPAPTEVRAVARTVELETRPDPDMPLTD